MFAQDFWPKFFVKQFFSLTNEQVPSSIAQMRPIQLNQNCSAIQKMWDKLICYHLVRSEYLR